MLTDTNIVYVLHLVFNHVKRFQILDSTLLIINSCTKTIHKLKYNYYFYIMPIVVQRYVRFTYILPKLMLKKNNSCHNTVKDKKIPLHNKNNINLIFLVIKVQDFK